jgi:exonuclease III
MVAVSSRILSLNLRHGGGSRANLLIDWIASKAPFVAVLTEWRENASGRLIKDGLTRAGLSSVSAPRGPKINTALLASRDLTRCEIFTPTNSPVGDLALMTIDGINILGCYFPQRKAKGPFFKRCMDAAAEASHSPLLAIGDFNTGRNDLDIEGTGTRFDCADQFIALHEQAGLIDLWRFRHGERREWTWRSPKNGFRIDHAFGNQAFINRFPTYRCEIDHEPRLLGLTDHSAIVIDLDNRS